MCPASPRIRATLFAVLMWAAAAVPASGQEVRWRTDYDAARREARETGRPIFIDFGTARCLWCQRLDADTLRDPEIVRSLNEQFIPVKLDGSRHPALVGALKIHGFPALVLAGPEGRIIDTHEGYMDAAQLSQNLRHTLAAAKPPPTPGAKELLARARDDYRDGLYQGCREKCAALAAAFPTAPETAEAHALAGRVGGDTLRAGEPRPATTIRAQAP
jgi:thioredoxin-like negative regulator of GroEL